MITVETTGGEVQVRRDTVDVVVQSPVTSVQVVRQGVRGSRWWVSGPSTPDPGDVPAPLDGDVFLYPSSRDLFHRQGGEWVYVGPLGGP